MTRNVLPARQSQAHWTCWSARQRSCLTLVCESPVPAQRPSLPGSLPATHAQWKTARGCAPQSTAWYQGRSARIPWKSPRPSIPLPRCCATALAWQTCCWHAPRSCARHEMSSTRSHFQHASDSATGPRCCPGASTRLSTTPGSPAQLSSLQIESVHSNRRATR